MVISHLGFYKQGNDESMANGAMGEIIPGIKGVGDGGR